MMARGPEPTDTPTAAAGLVGSTDSWGWVLGCGVVMVAAGMGALAAPSSTAIALAALLGWILVFAGAAGIVIGVRTRIAHRRALDLLYGVASLIVGVIVLLNPLAGALSFTLAIALWLAFRGVLDFAGAGHLAGGRARTAMILAGIVNLLFALLLVANVPFPALKVIGLFVGVSVLVGGIATVIAALQLRRLATG